MRWHPGEEGASEVVGVMLLVGLTVFAVAVVAAIFLASPQPGEIPHAAIIAGNESVAGSENRRLILAHEGGDPLRTGEYRIYIDTDDGLEDKTSYFTEPKDDVWSIGESISYYVDTTALKRVVVTVLSGGSETILSVPAFVGGGSKFSPDPMEPEVPVEEPLPPPPINFTENVFVYGSALTFSGNNITGPGATIIVTGGLTTSDLNGGASINVSNIYIDGDVTLNDGGAGLGSKTEPAAIYINGDLNLMNGGRDIYGDVYVSGNLYLKDARIHGNIYVQGKADLVGGEIYGDLYQGGDLYLKDAHTHGDVYVNGNVELDWTPTVYGKIEHTGNLKKPEWGYSQSILDKCIQTPDVPEVPSFEMPDQGIPSTKPAEWYTSREYAPNGDLADNLKIFADSYTSTSEKSANNVVIIAYDGNISITGGWNTVTGIFFAPNGKVTFDGDTLEGVVIARNGFFATHTGSTVIFEKIEKYISDSDDYPF